MPPFIANLLAKPGKIVTLGVLALVGFVLLTSFISTRNGMVRAENALNAKYEDNQNVRSQYVLQVEEALGIADRSTAALDKVISDAVSGRYDSDRSLADPTGGALFSAIQENYPDASGVTQSYSKIEDAIFAGRDQFQHAQTDLLDRIRAYDDYRETGVLRPMWASILGAPTDRLRADNGADVAYGQAALDRMRKTVKDASTQQTYQTGIDEGIDTNPTPEPTK